MIVSKVSCGNASYYSRFSLFIFRFTLEKARRQSLMQCRTKKQPNRRTEKNIIVLRLWILTRFGYFQSYFTSAFCIFCCFFFMPVVCTHTHIHSSKSEYSICIPFFFLFCSVFEFVQFHAILCLLRAMHQSRSWAKTECVQKGRKKNHKWCSVALRQKLICVRHFFVQFYFLVTTRSKCVQN